MSLQLSRPPVAEIVLLTMAVLQGVSGNCPRFKDIMSNIGSVRCEGSCMTIERDVFGTLIYEEESNVCTAALHAGVIGVSGGIVVARPSEDPGRVVQGTCRNRVCSFSFNPSGQVFTLSNESLVSENVRGDVLLVHDNYKNGELNVLCLSEDPSHKMSKESITRWNYNRVGEPEAAVKSHSKVIITSPEKENRHAYHCLGRTPASDVLAPIIVQRAEYKTTQYTFRASKGDALQVQFSQPQPLPDYINLRKLPSNFLTKVSLSYSNVQPEASGLYIAGDGHLGAYFNVIVRDCEAGMYGNKCQNFCPECKNGGQCHSYTGECICPPGFTGDLCEKACPEGYVGNECTLQCSRNEFLFQLPNENSCKGLTFCLANPLGCTCAAGYEGVLCDQECELGQYGAGCVGSCQEKCQSNDCDPFTGKCPPTLPEKVEIGSSSPGSLTLSWPTSAADEQDKLYYNVNYKLLTHMSCSYEERNEEWKKTVAEDQPIVISGLEAHASYNMCLYIVRDSDSKRTTDKCFTAETGIEVPTLNVTKLECTPEEAGRILCSAVLEGTCAHYNGPNAELSFSLLYEDCNGTNVLIEESESLSPNIDQFHSGVINHTFYSLLPGHKYLPAVKVERVPVPEQRYAVPVYTDEKEPPPVSELEVFHWNETEVQVMWNDPCPSNGEIVSYNITLQDEIHELSLEDGIECAYPIPCGYKYGFNISNLKMGNMYNAKITVGTTRFKSKDHDFIIQTTGKPEKPRLQDEEHFKDSLQISILPPTSTVSKIVNCTVTGPKNSCVLPYVDSDKPMNCTISNLESGTNYTLDAYCCSAHYCGETLQIDIATRPSPLFQGSARVDGSIINSTIPLTLPKLAHTGNSESNIVVVVDHIKEGQTQNGDLQAKGLNILSNRRGRKDDVQENGMCGESTWIAAVLPGTAQQIDVGDGKSYGGFHNCPLEEGESYIIGILGITDIKADSKHQEVTWQQLRADPSAPVVTMTSAGTSNSHMLLVILGVEGLLIIIIVVAIIVTLCLRRRSTAKEEAAVAFTREPAAIEVGGEEPAYRGDDKEST